MLQPASWHGWTQNAAQDLFLSGAATQVLALLKSTSRWGEHSCCTSSIPIQSLPFPSEANPAKTVLSPSPSSIQAINFWLSQTSCFLVSRALCSPPPGEAGISLVSIRIGHRNQHIPVMLIYRPLGCQHKYLINTDMNNTA